MRKFTKSLMTLLLLCVAGVTNAQEWVEVPTAAWSQEHPGGGDMVSGEPQMVDDAYKVYVRSFEEAVANGFTGAKLDEWDSQFFINFGEANVVAAGDKVRVSFQVKADNQQTVGTQSHAAPGAYLHWYCIDNVTATTGWTTFEKTVDVAAKGSDGNFAWGIMAEGTYSIAFNLTPGANLDNGDDPLVKQVSNNFYFKDIKVEILKQKPATEITWTDLIINGDLEGEGTECFYVTEQGIGGPFLAKIYDGVGVNGSKGLMVQSGDNPSQDWDTQFFIRVPYILPEGTQIKVSFDYKASQAATGNTQAHANPGAYQHWACIGDVNFTEDWQPFENTVTINSGMAHGTNQDGSPGPGIGMQTIAFNLAVQKTATQYFFDNIKFEIDQEILSTLTLNPDPNAQPYPEPQPEDIEISPADGDISAALAAAEEGKLVGNITINLTEGVTYTVSDALVAPASITINGNGATIDASALEVAMITTPAGDLEEWMNGNFSVKDVTIKGLKKSLYASAGKNYLYNDFLIHNCIIEFNETSGCEFDFRKGGVAKNFIINNSTLYAPEATGNSLYTSQSAQKGIDAPGVETQSFVITNSTLYNLAKGKNFFTHRQANQTWLAYTIKNSQFVNCGKSGQVVKGINQGQSGTNPTWDIDGNIFNFDDADTSAEESTGDEAEPVKNSVAGVVYFDGAETGDFNCVVALAEGVEIPESQPGDPRWRMVWQQTAAPVSSGEVLYALAEGDTFTSGQTVEVLYDETGAKAGDVVATITYGEATEDAPAFNAAIADGSVEGYTAYTTGNGVNGNKPGGTFYTIVPKYDGVISAAIVLNNGKAFHLTVDGVQNSTFDGNTVSSKYYGTFEFNVEAGKAYKFYCDGSKLGFYGFNYVWGPEVEPITELPLNDETVGIATVNTAKQQGVYYNLQGVRVAQPTKGLYIINGKKVVVK